METWGAVINLLITRRERSLEMPKVGSVSENGRFGETITSIEILRGFLAHLKWTERREY